MSSDNSSWDYFQLLIAKVGWKAALNELRSRKYDTSSREWESKLLGIATIEQKFGRLNLAFKTLQELQNSPVISIRLDAKLRLAKIYSQLGLFENTKNTYIEIFKEVGVEGNGQHRISDSALWRFAFQLSLTNEKKKSKKLFQNHFEKSSMHASQRANNLLFSDIGELGITNNLHQSQDVIFQSYNQYLRERSENPNVKFLNLAKSLIVPQMYNGLLLAEKGDMYSAVQQLTIARRIMALEELSHRSEGIGDFIHCMAKYGSPLIKKLLVNFVSSKEFSPIDFGAASNEYFAREINELIDESIFTNDHQVLLIGSFKKKKGRSNMKDKVFIIHGHDQVNMLLLRQFLNERTDYQSILLSEKAEKGRTIIEKFEQEAIKCKYAIAVFTRDDQISNKGTDYFQPRPNVLFELGWFYGRIGRENVIIAFQEGVKVPSDLDGIARKQFKNSIQEIFLNILDELNHV